MTAAKRSLEQVFPASSVTIREVGLRDGLQMVKTFPSTDGKRRWIAAEYAAGVRQFEAGSFLPPQTAPAFADVLDVIAAIEELPGAYSSALALNIKGAVRGLASPVSELICVVSASEEHNARNVRRTREQSLEQIAETCRLRDGSERRPFVYAGIAMAFGCSISGPVDPAETLRIAERCLTAGADIVGLADTAGYAGPRQVAELSRAMRKLLGDRPFGIHLHDTRGLGIANASAALDEGARIIDASLGGLGGCPFAPRATGNIVIEDLVYLCETKGFRTGIDIERLVTVRDIFAAEMPDEPTYGALAKAGLPIGFAAASPARTA